MATGVAKKEFVAWTSPLEVEFWPALLLSYVHALARSQHFDTKNALASMQGFQNPSPKQVREQVEDRAAAARQAVIRLIDG